MEYWVDKDLLSEKEKCSFQNFFLSRFWIEKIDIAFFVVCYAEVAVSREQRNAVSEGYGMYTNPKSIAKLYRFYNHAFRYLEHRYLNIHLLDTTNIEEKQMVTEAVKIILGKLTS